jgi:alpha-tubulin suppressor-like RCC1 family protein
MFSMLSAQAQTTCAITGNNANASDNKQLYCWGDNADGQIGDNTTTHRNVPVRVGTSSWKDVSVGFGHTCGVNDSGNLYCWGKMSTGDNRFGFPDQISACSGLGTSSDCSSSGCGWTCNNDYCSFLGQSPGCCDFYIDPLGDCTGNMVTGHQSLTPMQVGTANDWKSVSTGFTGTCARKNDDSLHCWSVGSGTSPTQVSGSWLSVNSGGSSQCALAANGTLECAGRNTYGQLGNATGTGTFTIYGFAAVIGGHTNWMSPVVGLNHACALRAGEPFCWGRNEQGQLGLGAVTSGANATPTAVPRPAL